MAPTRDRNLGSRVRRFAFFIPAASGAAPELKSVEKNDLRIRGTRFSGGLHMKPPETAELIAFTRPVHFFVAPPKILHFQHKSYSTYNIPSERQRMYLRQMTLGL